MNGPTVMEVRSINPDEKMFAVHAVVEADSIFTVIRKLKILGARDILVLPVERLIP
jgi:ATP phosphoribosyltransferase